MENETLYLVDGSGYIYRAFYAVQPLTNSKGLPTNALFGFSRMLNKLIRDISAQHIAVAFDMGDKTFRHERYELYKANRSECPEDLVKQMPYFRDLVRAYGVAVLEQSGVEADDIIGTIARTRKDRKIVIVSGDKDLCQLVDERVIVWDAMRDIRYDVMGVEAKFGVKPTQIVDFLALTGDTSDNVPGISGVGPKTAVQLLQAFGDTDALLARTAEIETLPGLRGGKRVRELIEGGRETLALSKELVTLRCDVEPFATQETEEEYLCKGQDESLMIPLLKELEFKIPAQQNGGSVKGATAKANSEKTNPEKPTKSESKANPTVASQGSLFDAAPAVRQLNPNYKLASSVEEVTEKLVSATAFGFDTETDSLDSLAANVIGLSISPPGGEAFFFPFALASGENFKREEVLQKFQPFFVDPTKRKVASNLKYDLAVLRNAGLRISEPVGDTMLASYVLNPDHRQHGLKDLSRRMLGEEMRTYEELVGKKNIAEASPAEVADYAAHDADAALRVHDELMGRLSEQQKKLYEEIELPLVFLLEQIERTGIKVDREKLQSLSKTFAAEIELIEKDLRSLAGREINFNSPKQLGQLLFEDFGLPTSGIKKTTHGFSTDASALERLSKYHPFPAKLLEYREIFKLKSTYVDALQHLIREDTGRVHTSFNQAIAATGRLSSSDPNLQNIPIRNERGRRIRTAFVAAENCKLICADYSQVELRILAHLSGDASLKQAFVENVDIHTRTAELLFAGEFDSANDERKKELRRYAKTINFGVIYGMGAMRLADELSISRGEAVKFIDGYFATYRGVQNYFTELEESAKRDGYVETLFGRRRYLRDIDTTGRDSGYAVRSVLNAPIQGTAADVIKLAMLKLSKVLEKTSAKIVLQVHDELIVECPTAESEEVRKLVVQEMSGAAALSVPLGVDSRIVDSWG